MAEARPMVTDGDRNESTTREQKYYKMTWAVNW